MTDTTTPQMLADRFTILTEDLMNELFDLYVCPQDEEDEDTDNRSQLLMQIADELLYKCRSYNNSDALVEKGLLSQKQVDDAKMYLLLHTLLSSSTTTTTYASLVASVRQCLVLATGGGTTTTTSLVLELLLDPRAVEKQLHPDELDGTLPGHSHRLLDLPRRRYDEYGNAYITGGLFDLQAGIQSMRRRDSSNSSSRNDDADDRPKKRRRVDGNNDDDNHETFAQLSLAYILVAMVYDSLQQHHQQQQPVTVERFLQEIQQLGMISPVLHNAFLASNAPFWFLFDTLLLSASYSQGNSSNSNHTSFRPRIPTDLTLSFIQHELCNIR
jgi:hypothetical protein